MTTNGSMTGSDMAITPFTNLTDKALSGIRKIYESVPATRQSLAVLFAVDAAQSEPAESWIGFFVETVCAQLVWEERPTGTLSAEDAAWILARFDEAPSLTRLAILVRIVEEAHRTPSDFAAEVRRRARMLGAPSADGKPERRKVPYLRLVA